jgi:hypothetical protein
MKPTVGLSQKERKDKIWNAANRMFLSWLLAHRSVDFSALTNALSITAQASSNSESAVERGAGTSVVIQTRGSVTVEDFYQSECVPGWGDSTREEECVAVTKRTSACLWRSELRQPRPQLQHIILQRAGGTRGTHADQTVHAKR